MALPIRWLALLALGLPACASLAPSASSPTASTAAVPGALRELRDARALADAAMQRVAREDLEAAFALLSEHWPLSAEEIEGLVVQSVRQRATLESRFGESLEVEFVERESVHEAFVRFTYLEKFAHHALVWRIYFYKPRDAWRVNSVVWSDEIQQLFP